MKQLTILLMCILISNAVAQVNANSSTSIFPSADSVLDSLDMKGEYVFDFTPSQNLLDVLVEFDLLPAPSGVAITITLPP